MSPILANPAVAMQKTIRKEPTHKGMIGNRAAEKKTISVKAIIKPVAGRKQVAAIDDHVRLYLAQMGGNPLLTRACEVSSAQQIELWRRKFRNTMLANDFILTGAKRNDCSSESVQILKHSTELQTRRNYSSASPHRVAHP